MKNLTGIYWIKNEARYLPEYMEFHMLQGFDHFIFYDNGSTDDSINIRQSIIERLGINSFPNCGYGRILGLINFKSIECALNFE